MSFPIQRDISRQKEIAFKAIKQQLAALRKGQAPGQGGTLAQLQAQLENLLLQIAGLSKGSGGGGSTVQAQSPIVENFVHAAGTSAAFPYAAYESGSGVVSARAAVLGCSSSTEPPLSSGRPSAK